MVRLKLILTAVDWIRRRQRSRYVAICQIFDHGSLTIARIHTWPETGYAALDLFMCGRCDPRAALPLLEAWFSPGRTRVTEHRRG